MPTVTGNTVHWHAPKSAGTFITKYMVEALGGERVGGPHDPAWYGDRLGLDGTHKHFGCVRNPWDWYPSLYRHARMMIAHRGGDTARAWSGGNDTFRDFLWGATGHRDPPASPLGLIDTDAEYPPPTGGLWSWLVRYMYQQPGSENEWLPVSLYASDRLYEALWAGQGWNLDPLRWGVHNTSISRETRGEPPALTDYFDWYTDEMVEWVHDADRDLVEHFDFYPFSLSPSPILQTGA